MKSLYENKMTAKNTLTRNVSLHVYYASLKQSEKTIFRSKLMNMKKHSQELYP